MWYTQIDTADGSYLVDPKHLFDFDTDADWTMYAVCDDDDNVHLLYTGYVWNGEEWYRSPLHAKVDSTGNLLASNHVICDDPVYAYVSWDKGMTVDSDGNVHVAYTYYTGVTEDDYSVAYRKIDGDDGSYLTDLIDVGYPTQIKSDYLLYEPYDVEPAICIDSNNHVHISYRHDEDYESYIGYVILDLDGNVLVEPKLVFMEHDVQIDERNFFITADERIFLFANVTEGYGFFEFDENGDLIGEPQWYTPDVMVGSNQMGPFGAVDEDGLIRTVGHIRQDSWDYDIGYVHQLEGSGFDEPVLSAENHDDGILLSWREEGDLTGSSWRLERDGESLVNLSGDAIYRYLDRDAEPNVTHLYILEATLPDGSVRRFGPVEATWQGSDAGRFTLYAPFPCPAADRVTLSYYLPEGTKNVELSLYDLSGRLVESSVSVPTTPGRHEIAYDTSTLPPGVYLVRLAADAGALTRRVVIAR
ncbi:MAG TPA: T9SS type A sorting domain-containing protein [bacterium]|nr:T9SS type A sorting domain-containing protein [bacterium]